MGLFKQLFGQREKEKPVVAVQPQATDWQELPAYIAIEAGEAQLVSVVATALVASDSTNDVVIKRLLKRNPEAQLVSLIATSLATGEQPESVFRVKSIKEKKN